MKRILILMYDVIDYVNGAISVYITYCNMLSESGYDVSVGCPYKNARKPERLSTEVNFYSTEEDTYKNGINDCCERFVREISPDIIVIFFPFLYPKLPSQYDNIPRILMFHSYPTSQLPPNIIVNPMNNNFVNTCVQVLQPSFVDALPDYIKEWPVVVIPNGIDQYTKQTDYDFEKKRIVFLSRVDENKGVHKLIDAFNKISQNYKDWFLDIYGQECNAKYSISLREKLNKYNLNGRVSFRGVIENKEEYLPYYDFCVFPSSSEAFSLGLGECMSAGLPCIGFKTSPGVNEMIVPGLNGILCDDNTDALAEAIETFIDNRQLRKELGLGAKNWVSKFSHKSVNKMWLDLIESILENGLIKKVMR